VVKHFIFKCLLLHVLLFKIRDYIVVVVRSLIEGCCILVMRERNVQKKMISPKSILIVGNLLMMSDQFNVNNI